MQNTPIGMEVIVDGHKMRRAVAHVEWPRKPGAPCKRVPVTYENERAVHMLDGRVVIIKTGE